VRKPEVSEAASTDRMAELIRGPRSGPLAGAPTPASATAAGFAVAFAVPFATGVIIWILASLGGAPNTVVPAVALVASLAEIAAILAVVRYGEKRLLGSVGIRPPAADDLKLGVGVGFGLFVLSILIPSVGGIAPAGASVAIVSHVRVIYPDYAIPASLTSLLFGLLVVAVTAIARELAMRGFAASRLRTLSGSVLIGGAGALALDLAAHLPLWGMESALVFAPAEAMLVGLFLWKRRLLPCIVANFTAGAMVLILVAAAGTPTGAPLSRESASPRAAAPGSAAAAPKSPRERAIEKLRHALESNSSPAGAFVERAAEEAEHGDYKQAVAEMDKAIAKYPDTAYLYFNRGVLYASQNLHEQALADFTKAISLSPDVDLYRRERALEYTHMGDNLSAHRDYAKAIAINPKDPENYRERAALYQSENRYPAALRDIDEAIKLRPSNAKFYLRRAAIRVHMRQYKRALADCDQIIKLSPSSTQGYGCRYDVYNASGDKLRAIASLDDSLKVSPGDVGTLGNRADLELQLGRWSAARADFEEMAQNASVVDPEDANWAAMTLAASSHPQARDGKAALILARHACEATGYRNARYVATLAAAYAEEGDFARAIKWQKVAIGLEPNEPHNRSFDIAVLRLYENRKPLRGSDFAPGRRHKVLRAIAGGIILILTLIGLITVIVWIVKLANRRRRSRHAAA
jgi:tetratricopeptide (TPR) repeat protein